MPWSIKIATVLPTLPYVIRKDATAYNRKERKNHQAPLERKVSETNPSPPSFSQLLKREHPNKPISLTERIHYWQWWKTKAWGIKCSKINSTMQVDSAQNANETNNL